MDIHSKILVHWTGKKVTKKGSRFIKETKYVERLKDYYQKGLFAKRTYEDSIRNWKIKNLIRICFTEIRLSQVQKHANRYGKLGIGFTRDFIINKGGRPVIYIPFKPKDGILEESITQIHKISKSNNDEIHMLIKWIMAHVKRMSNGKSEDSPDYENYYEEMEWRLVYDESPDNKHFIKGKSKDFYRLKFGPSDIKIIIFPNEHIMQMSLKDADLKKYFSKHMPILVTLEDCTNF